MYHTSDYTSDWADLTAYSIPKSCAKSSPVSSWLRGIRVLRVGHRACSTLLVALCIIAFSGSAMATIVERVVAVVGERAILMSDLRERARPFLVRIHQELPAGAQRAAAISPVSYT